MFGEGWALHKPPDVPAHGPLKPIEGTPKTNFIVAEREQKKEKGEDV
jgi:hypothetical protein